MPLRVTFDSNTLDFACRPERFHKDPRQPELAKVKAALSTGQIKGFYSVTLLTIEAVMRRDRALVLAGTTVRSHSSEPKLLANADLPPEMKAKVGEADVITVTTTLTVDEPHRQPIPEEFKRRVRAAKDLGVKVLQPVPRIGAFRFDDPTGEFYLDIGHDDALGAWIDKAHEVGRAIESRGCGYAQVKALGLNMSNPSDAWYQGLTNAKDIHEERAVERAFSEWADGDAIASHIAHGIEVFCTGDVGRSNAGPSVLNVENRAWLTRTYGVKFMTFDELLTTLP